MGLQRVEHDWATELNWTYLLGASQVAQWLRIHLPMQEMQIQSLGLEDPLEKEMATHSSILAWKNLMDSGSWRATVHRVTKSQARLSNWASQAHLPSWPVVETVLFFLLLNKKKNLLLKLFFFSYDSLIRNICKYNSKNQVHYQITATSSLPKRYLTKLYIIQSVNSGSMYTGCYQ